MKSNFLSLLDRINANLVKEKTDILVSSIETWIMSRPCVLSLLFTSFLLARKQQIDARLTPVTLLKNLPRGGSDRAASSSRLDLPFSSPFDILPVVKLEEIVATGLVGGATNTDNSNANADEGASIPTEIFNLVKSIVGAGVLGLPAGTRESVVYKYQTTDHGHLTTD